MVGLFRGERIQYECNPEGNLLIIWTASTIIYTVVLVAGITALYAVFEPMGLIDTMTYIFLLGFVLAGFVLIFLYKLFMLNTYEYYITNMRVIWKGGMFSVRERSLPFGKINDTEVTQDFFRQVLGISDLKIHAGGQELVFEGLKDANKPSELVSKRIRR
ncbi:PH domain-containing protein [Candidatus Woesearchaeota archaeon]|nr:PH domain-containing protein [Candidatus Woesearchaeota archaeon]